MSVYRAKQWVVNLRRKDLDGRNAEYLNKNCDVCEEHFEDCMFMNQNTRNSLVWSAVPTIVNVPNPPKKIAATRKAPKHRMLPAATTVQTAVSSTVRPMQPEMKSTAQAASSEYMYIHCFWMLVEINKKNNYAAEVM